MLIEIKSWLDGKILFRTEAESLKAALETAVKAEVLLMNKVQIA